MKRQLLIWALFATFLTVGLAAMGWISLTIVRLDRAEADARQRAQLEENVRLALWRMDSAVGQLIAQENVRPAYVYSAFYPVERAYDKEVGEIRQTVYMPSPLLDPAGPYVLLYFQLGSIGMPSSPQVPEGRFSHVAGRERYVSNERVAAALGRLAEFKKSLSRADSLASLPLERPASTQPGLIIDQQLALRQQAVSQPAANPQAINSGTVQSANSQGQQRGGNVKSLYAADSQPEQEFRGNVEYYARNQFNTTNNGLILNNSNGGNFNNDDNSARLIGIGEATTSAMVPMWLGDKLVLARRASISGQDYIQGCWLNWPVIQESLLASVKTDLLPSAELRPIYSNTPEHPTRMMATLPVLLVPGALPIDPSAATSPIRLSLLIAWGCVVLAGAAVGTMLRSSLVLSERRAAFVSTVTHELRTPLTTLRMYGEMLEEGMVDQPKRQQYLGTLRTEADRLGRLVDNVLAYSRIERGKLANRIEDVTVAQMLQRSKDRLADRAAQAKMQLCVEADEQASAAVMRIDSAAVEQILFNLVDNACKYAGRAQDRRIHLTTQRTGRWVLLCVRDHGPGVLRSESRRLFRPFSKAKRDESSNIPGVGLGLALSRRLARQMGGNLSIDTTAADGACFVVEVPGTTGVPPVSAAKE